VPVQIRPPAPETNFIKIQGKRSVGSASVVKGGVRKQTQWTEKSNDKLQMLNKVINENSDISNGP